MHIIGKKSKNLIQAQENLDKVLAKVNIQKSIEKIRKKWDIDIELGPHDYLEKYDCTNLSRSEYLLSDKNFSSDLQKILKDNKLHKGWLPTLEEYTYWGEIDLKLNPVFDPNGTHYEVGVSGNCLDPYTYEPEVVVSINSRTSLGDLQTIWKEVQKYFKDFKPKSKRPWGDYLIAKDIYYLRKSGYKYDKIREGMKRKYSEVIYTDYLRKLY